MVVATIQTELWEAKAMLMRFVVEKRMSSRDVQ